MKETTPSDACNTKSRRMRATAAQVALAIATAQKHGLNPTSIILHSDGSTEIKFGGDADATQAKGKSSWEDI